MRYPLAFTLLIAQLAHAEPQWIWTAKSAQPNEKATFETKFQVANLPAKARLLVSCDNGAEVMLNGKQAGKCKNWDEPLIKDIAGHLIHGENTISIRARNDNSTAAGLIVRIIDPSQKNAELLASDATWRWRIGHDESGEWQQAVALGQYGVQPWGEVFSLNAKLAPEDRQIQAPEGFAVELVYSVSKSEEGSWVCLTVDEKGRIFAGDQDQGHVYRLTLGETPAVERLKLDFKGGHPQGLLAVKDSLYVMRNGGQSGLHKCTDRDGDGQYEEQKLLRGMEGGGEHGPHAVVLGPNGKSLYLVGGNHTKIPKPENSLSTPVWQEDHLLPRMWDARGHAVGLLAPGGWICRTDFEGQEWTLVSMGYRNQYDLAFNAEGEAFTYDADMEWDVGMPWYRPTRICHATVGSEFGWRSGSGKWPSYYMDSLPAAADIGPGSPVGVVFGTGAKFPERYQRALFALDWTYGTLYAVHLTPRGASYWGEKEAFITGKPLPLTDAVVHPDGNLYFAIGGRGNQSALYRVRYTGQESTAPAAPRPLKKQCQWRRELEAAMETPPGPENVEKAWKLLGNEDRFLRFAARTLLEKQPVALWSEKAIQERETIPSALDALCALARMGDKSMQPRILSALQWVQSQDLRESEALDMLRVYSLCFLRMGAPSDEVKASLAEKFEPMFPSPSDALNKEVAEMLVYLGSKKVVPVALQTMLSGQEDAHADSGDPSLLKLNDRYAADIKAAQKSRPNRPQIALAYALQYATAGWTPELRRTYFRWFNSALKWQGGNSFTGFLENMRKQALTNVPSEMQEELKAIKAEMLATPQDLPRATGPGKFYTVEDLEALATPEKLKNRDLANGKKMYQAALCASCHRFGQEYSGVGPDLTGIANRYSIKDLAENIINPSKVISDQYESTQIDKIDGTALVGRILSEDGKTVKVAENPLLPESLTEVPVDQIKAKSRYPLSAMPAGLLASLNESEVLDLMAFLLSGGQ